MAFPHFHGSVCLVLILLVRSGIEQKSAQQGKAPEKNQQFSVFTGEIDGHPLIAMIATGLKGYPSKRNFPWFLGLSVPLINPTSDGLPEPKDNELLNSWEDQMEARIGAETHYIFIGHATWNGSREVLFYVAKCEPVLNKLQRIQDSHATRPFAVKCEKDETWSRADVYFNKD